MQHITAAPYSRDFTTDDISENDKIQINNTSKWFIALSLTTILMMLVGALTRLTGSGLSIPEWPLINGSLLYPFSEADWLAVFETYKLYPQYHILNSTMTLSEFKYIFFFEYFHRSITTAISFILIIASIKLLRIKPLRARYIKNVIVLFFILLIQALAGYYMVKSGLSDGQVNVSQYRLMIHLSLAFTFLASILWTLWSLIRTMDKLSANKITKTVKFLSIVIFVSICLQIMSGATVAGTKSGFQFNDWPLMMGQIIPENIISNNGRFSENILLNFTENPVTIQFFHRNIAYLITILAIVLILLSKKCSLNHRTELAVNVLAITLASQVVLGITTLMMRVPITLGVLHQLGAILLFVNMLYILFKLRNHEIITS